MSCSCQSKITQSMLMLMYASKMGGLPRPRKTGEQINKEGLLENGVLAKVCEPTDEIRRKYKP